jgi:hypothetical protein
LLLFVESDSVLQAVADAERKAAEDAIEAAKEGHYDAQIAVHSEL